MAKIVVVPLLIYSDLWPSVDQDHETLNKSIFNGWNFDQKHKRLDILLVKGGAALTQILITVKSKACN